MKKKTAEALVEIMTVVADRLYMPVGMLFQMLAVESTKSEIVRLTIEAANELVKDGEAVPPGKETSNLWNNLYGIAAAYHRLTRLFHGKTAIDNVDTANAIRLRKLVDKFPK